MRIIKANDYQEMGRQAANLIGAQIINKPDCILGLATGSTPISTYEHLIKSYENGDLDFSRVTTVNLDEYKGLSPENDQSYRYFMNEHLFKSVNVRPEATHVPNGLEPDADKACNDYNQIIADCGGIDLQLLGLGLNGHIGFNEPAADFAKKTHCVDLTESTINANSRFFASMDEVPKQAYTMGIQTIMEAKKVIVIVNGKAKAEIVKEAFFGPITPNVPASILQLHKDFVLIGDAEALSLIPELA